MIMEIRPVKYTFLVDYHWRKFGQWTSNAINGLLLKFSFGEKIGYFGMKSYSIISEKLAYEDE